MADMKQILLDTTDDNHMVRANAEKVYTEMMEKDPDQTSLQLLGIIRDSADTNVR